ncbi:MAG TPA: LysR family transcriptional regulator [Sulfurimonas sp.]|nr:LysR family transcriptional regulator [Sulfurimonas sp.]
MNKIAFTLESVLHLTSHSEEFLSPKRVQLLENITIYGSITKSAKALGISYKTAWAWINKMNLISAKPLVQRISGGKGGGGTIVTAFAKELICRFKELEALHHKHLESLDRSVEFLDNGCMQDSVFSRLDAKIIDITEHENRASVILGLKSGESLSAQVPMDFIKVNTLDKGSQVCALIESEAVSVSKLDEKELSSRNRLETKVKEIIIQEDEVLLKLSLKNDEVINAQITYRSYKKLNIKKEDRLVAIFKAYSITLLSSGERNE